MLNIYKNVRTSSEKIEFRKDEERYSKINYGLLVIDPLS